MRGFSGDRRVVWRLVLSLVVYGLAACHDDGTHFGAPPEAGAPSGDGPVRRGEAGRGDANPLPACGTPQDAVGCGCLTVGATRACYTGPAATQGVGTCRDGAQTCVKVLQGQEHFGAPGDWGPCSGDQLPAAEVCTDELDHNCNNARGCSDPECIGAPKCAKVCQPGQTKPCYTGPAGTSGVGACHAGAQTCNAAGQWDLACQGQVTPGIELFNCHDNIDNDCNGATDCKDLFCLLDAGCAPQACTPNATQPCYSGAPTTKGVAACQGGTQTCAADGKSWGKCVGEVLPTPEGGHCQDGLDNDCNGLVDCKDPTCATAAACCVPPSGTPPDGTIYAHSQSHLYTITPGTWKATLVGSFNIGDSITDLAVTPAGKLYGISFSTLYSVNKTTGQASLVAGVSGGSNNALTFLPDGSLLAADSAGDLKRINPTSGAVTSVGNFKQGLSSAGDLVAVANGTMYGVSGTSAGGGDAAGNNLLLRIDTATGQATVVGPIGFGDVWGLAFVNAKVIGFTTGGKIIEIDPQTGAGKLLATASVVFWGAAMSPLVEANPCP